jgi:hypothetical protein
MGNATVSPTIFARFLCTMIALVGHDCSRIRRRKLALVEAGE